MADERTISNLPGRQPPGRGLDSLPTIADGDNQGAAARDDSQTVDLPGPANGDETGGWQPGAGPSLDPSQTLAFATAPTEPLTEGRPPDRSGTEDVTGDFIPASAGTIDQDFSLRDRPAEGPGAG